MRNLRLLTLATLLFVAFSGFAQQSSAPTVNVNLAQTETNKVDVNKDIDLVVVYEQYVKEGYGSVDIYKKLANGYYFKSNYKAAKKWYEKWFEEEMPSEHTPIFRYRQTLKALNVTFDDNKYLAVADAN